MIVAGFDGRQAMLDAAGRLRDGGVRAETYSNVSPEEGGTSPLPLIMLLAGLLGAGGAFAMQCYATTAGYRIDIGGRPDLFWPAYVPFAFETGVLCAMAAGFFGFFAINRLPRLYDPVDEAEHFRAASRDGWFVVVRGKADGAADLLRSLHPATLEERAE